MWAFPIIGEISDEVLVSPLSKTSSFLRKDFCREYLFRRGEIISKVCVAEKLSPIENVKKIYRLL